MNRYSNKEVLPMFLSLHKRLNVRQDNWFTGSNASFQTQESSSLAVPPPSG
ncbi:MAG: hypothetical protein M1366_02135 [Patescibacteria group bacterium]|nr:hypothetical protein [Patescibacteria group bacterium]